MLHSTSSSAAYLTIFDEKRADEANLVPWSRGKPSTVAYTYNAWSHRVAKFKIAKLTGLFREESTNSSDISRSSYSQLLQSACPMCSITSRECWRVNCGYCDCTVYTTNVRLSCSLTHRLSYCPVGRFNSNTLSLLTQEKKHYKKTCSF